MQNLQIQPTIHLNTHTLNIIYVSGSSLKKNQFLKEHFKHSNLGKKNQIAFVTSSNESLIPYLSVSDNIELLKKHGQEPQIYTEIISKILSTETYHNFFFTPTNNLSPLEKILVTLLRGIRNQQEYLVIADHFDELDINQTHFLLDILLHIIDTTAYYVVILTHQKELTNHKKATVIDINSLQLN
ncbi:hypothetical protein LB941_02945 [Ligilactobacillus sp. WILCCON 0076]|uniref:Uncharacterized protein n=1 Tax=Ligilactobacillus ubinensis TaxID=2876789 RepID=A0A9X2FHQ6_9LACO|nr:hypothetical protein [Ligilactobacillus ubinensis]MCP0886294.1 hypothetical protein [Ligilactobacillus ubinensis]